MTSTQPHLKSDSLTCCPLTPPGVGAIAVIALRGDASWSLIRSCVQRPTGPLPEQPQFDRLYFGTFGDERETIDEVILAPRCDRSGALVGVDVSAHGGIRVVERILMTLTDKGAALVSPGECVIQEPQGGHDGWITRIKNAANLQMMRTTTRRAAMFLMNQAEVLPAAYTRIMELSDAGREDDAHAVLQSLVERSDRARHLLVPPRVSVVGPPNAGKSSLINALAGRDHVIVSDIEGTTRDWVTVPAVIEGIELTLVDTAGLRDTPDALEGIAIDRGRVASASSDLRIWVFDRSAQAPADVPAILAGLGDRDIVVANKSDRAASDSWSDILGKSDRPVLAASATQQDGLDEVRRAIVCGLGLDDFDDALPAEFDPERLARISAEYRTNSVSITSLAAKIRNSIVLD
ncbi:MAG TPA: 50S ribosome-binding GTPase [Phycisphaerae bacterium]|nr:50S ribosome-binding GTPase [Phycisphaerae bacterium]